jgi:hypothetical protein
MSMTLDHFCLRVSFAMPAAAVLLSVWIDVGSCGWPSSYGTGFLAIVKQGSKFGFSSTGDDFMQDWAQNVDDTISP